MKTLTFGIGKYLQGAHHRHQEHLLHCGCWIGDTGEGGVYFVDVSYGSVLSVF